MSSTSVCLLLSDFNVDNLAALLSNNADEPALTVTRAPFGQVHQALLDETMACWSPAPESVVIWTRPGAVIEEFHRLVEGEPFAIDRLIEQVDAFTGLIRRVAARGPTVMVPTWTYPAALRPFNLLDMRSGWGIENALMRLNLRLAENLEAVPNVIVLNAQAWLQGVGANSYSDKLWYLSKTPFEAAVFKAAVADMKACLAASRGKLRKLVVVDLDDTLWEGIVGDVGWEGLNLGGHHPVGEALVDFQKALKSLKSRGILLAIVSKNEEKVALEAIRRHPAMVLREDDFVGWRINWNDKARNLAELVAELNLGLQSVVFIDDSPVERSRVREALPEVLVPEWPADKTLYVRALWSVRGLNATTVTAEDAGRTESYRAETRRRTSQAELGDFDEWLASLKIAVRAERLSAATLARAAQLLNKTNQLNLRTRRLSEGELTEWLRGDDRAIWVFNVADRFGDSGLTGIVGYELRDGVLELTDFVLSCRVMGRRIEQAMLHVAVEQARRMGARTVRAEYVATARNTPCLKVFEESGFSRPGGAAVFEWDAGSKPYALPAAVELQLADPASPPGKDRA